MHSAGQIPAAGLPAAPPAVVPGPGPAVQHEHDVYHQDDEAMGAVSENDDEDWIPEPDLDFDPDADPDVDPEEPLAPAEEDADPDPPPDEEFSEDEIDDEYFDASDDEDFPSIFQAADLNPRLHQPLYKDATHSVLQAVFALVSLKIKNNMSDAAFEDMLHLNKLLAPQPNKYPSSFFRCKSMLGVKPIKDYEWHTCGCQETAWDPKGPSSPTDACEFCLDPRFKPNKRGKLVPTQVITDKTCYRFLQT